MRIIAAIIFFQWHGKNYTMLVFVFHIRSDVGCDIISSEIAYHLYVDIPLSQNTARLKKECAILLLIFHVFCCNIE